jgi:hypothetical protein
MMAENNDINAMFNGIVANDAIGEVVGAVHTVYQTAMAKGFPEQRAWELANNIIDKLWSTAEPVLKKFVEEEMRKH